MKLEVLQSCMGITDVEKQLVTTNVKSDAVIVNQCSESKSEVEELFYLNAYKVKVIHSNSKGLSRSRNIAILNSNADLCVLSDDDEWFVEDYKYKIITAFKDNPSYDIITFALDYPGKQFPTKKKSISLLGCLKINSLQIAFKRDKILEKQIFFDETMGAGSGNGGGEENKFLMDAHRKGLNILYVPVIIAAVLPNSESTWYFGYTKRYFINRGWSVRKLLGPILGILYIIYFTIFKYKIYQSESTMCSAFSFQLRGFLKRS